MENTGNTDRRRSTRFKGRREAILLTPLGPHHIRDISASGLCFNCDDHSFFPLQWPVEIVYAGTPLYMRGVSVRRVREKLGDDGSFIVAPTKEIAVEFVEMDTPNQQMLKQLIDYHATDQIS